MATGTNEILAIEPWHGNNLVWYKATGDLRKDPWHRHRIDDTLNRGHSLAAVDVDGDGVLEIICGYNGEGTSLHLYRPENLEKNRWHKETIDDGGLGRWANARPGHERKRSSGHRRQRPQHRQCQVV